MEERHVHLADNALGGLTGGLLHAAEKTVQHHFAHAAHHALADPSDRSPNLGIAIYRNGGLAICFFQSEQRVAVQEPSGSSALDDETVGAVLDLVLH